MSDVEKRIKQMLSMQKENSKNNENTIKCTNNRPISDGRIVMEMMLGVNTIFKNDEDE